MLYFKLSIYNYYLKNGRVLPAGYCRYINIKTIYYFGTPDTTTGLFISYYQ